ncbi:C_GCAxxG_C_C family protein [Dysgonomonas sp. Marseille-P4677]|uniref:C-GCAxxG-C-C family protein n=1 Tax=Dysgonomonas sp. Marseille-P4677 TaxID=2364790 RepID=UPI001912587B|nr:C-GCAxxG-C-C family protein [Dysgonomonas sp. Marseille-P4677]MBK5719712.1 C_GCAxxG_C_C family protein [Dysgonomonas sp. Marseille-P4677]
MNDRVQKAKSLFEQGYNCSQSVFVAYSDLHNIDEKTALKLATSFGGGFAGTRNICGAVSAMAMVAGLRTGTTIPNDKEGKANNYAYVNSLIEKFKNEFGSILCKHLIGLEESTTPVRIKECSEYISYCAQLLENKE